jgi:hypothetical protein
MKLSLDSVIAEIKTERLRQQALPGSEYDLTYGVNDWISIVIHYLTQDVNRKGIKPDQGDYHNNLVRAAAIIIAALEHEDTLVNKNKELVKDNGIDKERQKL